MLLLDVNVVIAAHRADHPHHDVTSRWLDTIVAARESFGIPNAVWASFLRIVTNERAFSPPSSVADAFDYIDVFRDHPSHRSLEPGALHLLLLRRVCEDAEAHGALVPDAVLAAIAIEHGCGVASLDRDFARFTSVKHVVPGRD